MTKKLGEIKVTFDCTEVKGMVEFYSALLEKENAELKERLIRSENRALDLAMDLDNAQQEISDLNKQVERLKKLSLGVNHPTKTTCQEFAEALINVRGCSLPRTDALELKAMIKKAVGDAMRNFFTPNGK